MQLQLDSSKLQANFRANSFREGYELPLSFSLSLPLRPDNNHSSQCFDEHSAQHEKVEKERAEFKYNIREREERLNRAKLSSDMICDRKTMLLTTKPMVCMRIVCLGGSLRSLSGCGGAKEIAILH